MRSRWKKALRAGALVLAAIVFLVLCFSLYLYFHKPALKGYLERTLAKTPGLTVSIGRLHYRVFPLRAEARSVKVAYVGALGRADITADRLEAAGSLSRILNGRKPYLDDLSVSGLRIEFTEDPNAPSTGQSNFEDLARTISGYLEYVPRAATGISSLRVSLPAEGLDISGDGIELRASRGDRDSVSISANRLDILTRSPEARLSAKVKLEAGWPRSGPLSLDGNLELADSTVAVPGRKWQAIGVGFRTGFRDENKVVTLSPLALDMPGLLSLSGSATVGMGKDLPFAVTARLEVKDIGAAKQAFSAFLPPNLPELSVDGEATWEGEVRREASSGTAKVTLDGTVRLPKSRVMWKRGDLAIDQVLSAEARVQGEPSLLHAKGQIDGSAGGLTTSAARASGLSFRLPFEFEGGRVALPDFAAKAAELSVPAGNGAAKLNGLTLSGRGGFDLATSSAVADALTVEVPGVGRLDLTGKAGAGPKATSSVSLEARALDIGAALDRLTAVIPQAAAWRPAGLADLSLHVESEPDRSGTAYRLRGSVRLSKSAFQDATGTIVSEGLEPGLEFEGAFRTAEDPVPFSLSFGLAKGESLWKDAYFNWTKEPLRVEAKGEFDPRTMAVRGAGLKILFGPVGELEARGSAEFGPRPRFMLHLAAPSVDLARLHAFVGQMSPAQSSTLETSGRASVEADVKYAGSFEASGLIKVRDARAAEKDGSLLLAGLGADLPFSISKGFRPGDDQGDYSMLPGFVQVQEAKTSSLSLSSVRLDFWAARNMFLLFPVEIDLWGARLGLGHTVLTLSQAGLSLRGASTLSLSGLDLAKLPASSGSVPLAGTAEVPEAAVELSPREFRFGGRMLAELFGGKLIVDEFRITDVFAPSRRIMLQAEMLGLDLGKLTATVPFGDVTGIVDVSVRDLVLSYGQPESFALTIRSVPTKGVSQKFSLKAVNNLSVISSGGPSAGSPSGPAGSFLTKFVNSFHYSRMGIACSLRNDIFTLQGTIVEGGVQYLVRRATFFGIDVVNAKPVNTISFKDMVGRLERVGQSPEKK